MTEERSDNRNSRSDTTVVRRLVWTGWKVVGSFAVGLALVAVLVGWSGREAASPARIVATIGGMPLEVGEFRLFMEERRSDVFEYFVRRYGARDSARFWTSSFGGDVPIERLRREALSAAVEAKAEQRVAILYGLLTAQNASYSAFLTQLRDENLRRAAALAKGQPIYGPQRYSPLDFYIYLANQRALAVTQILSSRLSAGKVRRAYLKHRSLYRGPPTVRFEEVSIPVRSPGLAAAAQRTLDGVRARMSSGMQTLPPLVERRVETIGGRELELLARSDQQLAGELAQLPLGRFGPVIATSDGHWFAFVRVLKRHPGGFLPLRTVAPVIRSILASQAYDGLVRRARKEMTIETNESVLDQMFL